MFLVISIELYILCCIKIATCTFNCIFLMAFTEI